MIHSAAKGCGRRAEQPGQSGSRSGCSGPCTKLPSLVHWAETKGVRISLRVSVASSAGWNGRSKHQLRVCMCTSPPGAPEIWAALCPVLDIMLRAMLDTSLGGCQPWELDIKGPMSPPPSLVPSALDAQVCYCRVDLLGQECSFRSHNVPSISISLKGQDKLVDRHHHDAAQKHKAERGDETAALGFRPHLGTHVWLMPGLLDRSSTLFLSPRGCLSIKGQCAIIFSVLRRGSRAPALGGFDLAKRLETPHWPGLQSSPLSDPIEPGSQDSGI